MATRTIRVEEPAATATNLRREISARNLADAHETTYGAIPSVLLQDGANFHPASYKRILANPEWARRLAKSYTASSRVAHSQERERKELECAVSSDALLMSIFCHPRTLRSGALQTLLGIAGSTRPEFGVRVRTPLRDAHEDRTEMDMRVEDLLLEAKLSETGFQTARADLLARYEAFEDIFDTEALPRSRALFRGYQLLRGILAAQHADARYAVCIDQRRPDLRDQFFAVMLAVRYSNLRSRILLITWQEVAETLAPSLRLFLAQRYGIVGGRR